VNVHNRPWRAKLIVTRAVAGFVAALLLVLALSPTTADAASNPCTKQSRTLSLSNGSVSPGSGTSATPFVFSVRYRDSGNCAPNYVTVQISGVGTVSLSGSGSYDAGVVFSKTVYVSAVGTHSYSFQASSGKWGGVKSVQLNGVTPSTFAVSAGSPTPPPPPPPTPKPTAPPPPPATPKPTPKPTAPPPPPATPKPTAAATSTQPATTAPTSSPTGGAATPTAEPSGVAVIPGTTGSSPSPAGEPVAGSRGTPKPQPGAIGAVGALDDSPVGVVRFATWLAITAGGLGLFLLLARRPREEEEAAEVAPAGFVFDRRSDADSPTPEYLQGDSEGPGEEANMPRWLRPSVQSARRRSVRD
jgi:hypothetical protein